MYRIVEITENNHPLQISLHDYDRYIDAVSMLHRMSARYNPERKVWIIGNITEREFTIVNTVTNMEC